MTSKSERQLTGRHVLFILLTFFGVMLAVNTYFTVMAVKSFRGEDVPRSYRQGLEYNQTLQARTVQKATGWTVRANLTDSPFGNRIILDIRDKEKRAIPTLTIEAKLRHPADTARDLSLEFKQDGGRYAADIEDLEGRWLLVATAYTDTQKFKFEHELWR